MKGRQVGRVNQQSKGETPLVSGVLQRAAVRAVPEKDVQPTFEEEATIIRESRFHHNFSQVPISTGEMPMIQPKLKIGAEGDRYEQEADKVAQDEVEQNGRAEQIAPLPQQAQPQHSATEKRSATERARPFQAKGEMTGNVIDSSEMQRLNKTGLPDRLKTGIENLSKYSLDHVQVHYNSPKPSQLQALAYTQGTEIHIAPGQQEHLPHEAWHVVQQMQGRVNPTMQMQRVQINDDEELEKEADVMGVRAIQMKKKNQAASTIPVQSHGACCQLPPIMGVLQAVWEDTAHEDHATQRWTPVEGGVAWYTDGNVMWYRVTDLKSIKESWRSDFQDLQGYDNRRTWEGWNKTSVQPSLEWVREKSRPARLDEDHEKLLNTFKIMYGKGVEYWSMLTKALTQRPRDSDHGETFNTRYTNTKTANADLSVTAREAVGGQRDGIFSVSTASKGAGKSNAAYSNFVDPKAGIILADSNYAEKDIDSEQTLGTKRVPNSEILVNQLLSVGGDLKKLNQIIRSNIANQKTQEILSLIEQKILDRNVEKTWTPANPEFFALLGTDNVKGIAFLLSQHVEGTGGKSIVNIVTKGIAYIKINLG